MINIGIDATNITSGGGLNHLVEILRNSDPRIHKFEKIVVWGSHSTLNNIIDKDWIIKRTFKDLDKNIFFRAYWQWKHLGNEVLKERSDILFVPGGSFVTSYRPVVTMNQNILPFETRELLRYGFSFFLLKLLFLRMSQTYSVCKANGVIFLSKYAKNIVYLKSNNIKGKFAIISHGINSRFFREPSMQRNILTYSKQYPFRLIYISPLEPYKHHKNVVEAVSMLRSNGYPIVLDMYGYPSRSFVKKNLDQVMLLYDPDRSFINYHGVIDHGKIQEEYFRSDVAIFASSCESFGQILLEGMASGLPTSCSDMSAMQEILRENGIYFNPLDPISIKNSLQEMIESVEERTRCSCGGYKLSLNYSWVKCANLTFSFLSEVANKYRNENI
jgi:glycosyltransferase involved in cell wall biosynthesis